MRFFKLFCILLFLYFQSIVCVGQHIHFGGGYEYSIFICNNKTLYSWGDNYYGQLGRFESECPYTKPCPIPTISSIKSVDAGFGGFCVAANTSGNVFTWGHNFFGELGAGVFCNTICERVEPGRVLGGETGTEFLTNVQSIATGQSHAYALLFTGEVVAWGNNSSGQLGDGSTTDKASPVYVKLENGERLHNIVQISSGAFHAYALSSDGSVYAWGNNQNNQLGIGNSNSQLFPKKVVDKNNNQISGIIAIDAGKNFGLLLRNSSMVYGLGAFKGTHINESGTIYKTLPYAEFVEGGQTPNFYLENIIAISAGQSHSVAIIKENNTTYAVTWGDNRFENINSNRGGQIGNGDYIVKQFFSPQYVRTSLNTKLSGVTEISAGCGVSYFQAYSSQLQENRFYVCGVNFSGQLGTEDNTDRYFATRIDAKLCAPYCGGFSLGQPITYCSPINETIHTGFPSIDFSFTWYRNNILLPQQNNSITITEPGVYKVEITHNTGECAQRESEITIFEKELTFQYIQSSFCNSNPIFKIIGTGNFTWYNAKDGFIINNGNYLTISKNLLEEIIPDSVYRVWIQHENQCQKIPFTITKKCDCEIDNPIVLDTTSCYNREYFVHAKGDSIIWHTDLNLTNPIFLGNTYYPKNLQIGNYSYYATQVVNGCESSSSPITLELTYCEPWFEIHGKVLKENSGLSYSKVYLINSLTSEILDSTISKSNGNFTLYTRYNVGKILAISPSNQYLNTWCGNTINEEHAYEFIIDASIKGVEIRLIPINQNLSSLITKKTLQDLDYIDVYTVQGTQIGTTQASYEAITNLCKTNGVYILQGIKNQEIQFISIWIKK